MVNNCPHQCGFLFFWLLIPFITFSPKRDIPLKQSRQNNDFASFTETIPGTKVSFEMMAIPGGEFLMGSPPTEKGHRADEGPVHAVLLDSFWMAKLEITWAEFELFVYPDLEKEQYKKSSFKNDQVDAVTRPSPPFEDMSFGMGKEGYPAVNMTQYAARTYCKWLTAKTGHFYRLPTEAEWEYACRADSKTAYSFGDNIKLLNEYAWYNKNSEEEYHKVGTKKPNKWGLYDMHGNVAEWTLDQYLPDFYASFDGTTALNPWAVPATSDSHAVRGGSWYDGPESLRSSARRASTRKWKKRDPQIPKSSWWNTDAAFVGFRILRPVKQPAPEQIAKYFAAPLQDN